jgi:hypothetical protein
MTLVYVCRKCKDHACVTDFLERTTATIEEVRCQKVCHKSLVGFDVHGRLEWFERVAKPGRLADLAVALCRGTSPSDRLQKRRVSELSGRQPRR